MHGDPRIRISGACSAGRNAGPLLRRSVAAAVATGLLIVASGADASAEEAAHRRSGAVDESLRRAVAHTVSTQLPNGLFRYDFDFLSGEPSGADNIVRQAGTLFALGEFLRDTPDPAVAEALRKGLEAMRERSLPTGRGTGQRLLETLGVFSSQSWRLGILLDRRGLLHDASGDGLVVSGNGSYPGAFSGATSLAILGELEYFIATGDDRYRELREAWLRGLLALRVPGRGVRDHPATLSEGPYVNGEAWLALAVYHERFPAHEDAAQALAELEDYVIELYSRQPDRNFYHWGAMASAARIGSGDAERLAEFAAGQAEFILDARPPEQSRKQSTCSLIEGLASAIAAVGAAPGRDELLARLRDRVTRELAHNRSLQIRAGQVSLPVGGGGVLNAPTLADNHGAFLAGPYRAYTRTDLTQHCISALLKVRRYGLDGSGGALPPRGS